MISIVRVENEKQLKAFIEFPYGLYKDDRYWVPPLRRDMYHLFDVSQNPFWAMSASISSSLFSLSTMSKITFKLFKFRKKILYIFFKFNSHS